MDSDSSSEDEVFFGPITDKEKQIAARYHGRKTLILPQRNPLYRRWSTTHIPSAFTTDDKVTLASSSNSPATSQCMSQDHCSISSMLSTDKPAGSQPLSLDRREDSYCSAFPESSGNSFESWHENVSPITMTNSSCYSSMGNLADDERSINSIKLDNIPSPVSQSKNQSKLVEAVQLQGSHIVPTPPHDPVIYKNTVSALSSHPSTPILPVENIQKNNFSSPRILHYDQSLHSLAIPTSDSSTLASLTMVGSKPSSDCPKDLCGNLKECNVKCKEHDCCFKKSQESFREPLASPSEPRYTSRELQCIPESSDNRKPDDREPSSSLRKSDSKPCSRSRKPGDSEPSICAGEFDSNEPSSRPNLPDDSYPSISPRKPDGSEPSISPRKPDDNKPSISSRKPDDSEPSISPRKPDDSEPSTSPRKPDDSKPSISPRKPDDSEPSISPRKPDDSKPFNSPRKPDCSESFNSLRKPDDSKPFNSPGKPNASKPFSIHRRHADSEPFDNLTESGCSEPCSSLRKPCISEPCSNPRNPDSHESFSSLPEPNGSAGESVNSLLNPCNTRECVDHLRVSQSNLSKSPTSLQMPDSSPKELSALSSFCSSPRFNDTLEEIEQFLRHGVDYGETSIIPSGGTQTHPTSPTHYFRDHDCNPKEPSVQHRDLPCITNEPDNSFTDPDGKDKEPYHCLRGHTSCLTEPESNLRKPPSPQNLGSGLRELSASASSLVSPKFNDTLEEIEQFLKYGVDYDKIGTSTSGGSQGYIISSARSSCSTNFQPPLESTRASGAVTDIVDDEGKEPPLQEEKHPIAHISMEKTPLNFPLQAKTVHTTAAHSLPPLPTTTSKVGLARPVQHVTPTSRAPVSLPRSQSVRVGVGNSSTKATLTPKVVKSQPSSHTPTTSSIQPKAPRVKLQLGNSTATPTPKAAGLPPHPQRRPVPRLVPKKTHASSDGRQQRMMWHKGVASPLAKELRNNPPPPLVVNVKSTSSQSHSKWHPPSSPSCQKNYKSQTSSCNLFSKGSKTQNVIDGTPSPKVFHDKDNQVLPVANYKTGRSVTLNNKENKENTKRQCCKPTPVHEVKVIKHTGRMMVASLRNTSQGSQGQRDSLMEVSVHQPISSD